MKRIFVVLMVSLLVYSCKKSAPSDIIEADKMEKILYDIHVVDGYLATGVRGDSVKNTAASYYNGIFKKFGVDSASYNKSLNYYYKHPTDLSAIYEKIQNKVNSEVRGFFVADSLKNAKETRKVELVLERKSDSILVNRGYQFNNSDQTLFLPRFKAVYSENYVAFDVRKLGKDKNYDSLSVKPIDSVKVSKVEAIAPLNKDSLKTDSLNNKKLAPGVREMQRMQRLKRNLKPENIQ